MADCLFCKIAAGEIPTNMLYEDDIAVAFADIDPQAPVHILVIPKTHITSVDALTDETAPIATHCLMVAAKLAKENGLSENGYRIVTNIGEAGGQSVPHLHFHLLGGRNLGWPPG